MDSTIKEKETSNALGTHSITMQGMNGGVSQIDFCCGDKVVVSGNSDRNINMNCPICQKDFVTTGKGFGKIILG